MTKFIENEECPYLAGYSKDGRHFYLDKRFKPVFQLKDGRRMDTRKYLMIHEKTEKQNEDATGQSYQHSHELATGAERKAVEADGYPWKDYQAYCLREAKRLTPLDSEVPGDIDLKPEHDYNDKKMINKVHSLQKNSPLKKAGEKLAHLIREHRMLMHTLKHLDKPEIMIETVAQGKELKGYEDRLTKGMDLDLERRAKYLDNLPAQPANRPEVQAVMGGLGPLAKAAPTYEGELDRKGNRAVRHRQSTRHLVWEHAPDKQHHFQQQVLHHVGSFTQGMTPGHKAIIDHVADRIQKDPTRHYVESTHPQTKLQVPKLRHLAALVSGNPTAAMKPMENGNLLWRQERHGSVEPHTYWELSPHGIKDVTGDMKTQKKLKKSMYPLFGNPKKTEKASSQRKGNKVLATPAKLKRPKAKAATPGTLQKSVVLQVSTVAVINGDHILMGRRKDSGKLTFPGGHADAGEHPEQAAKRELFEEAGINAKELHYIGQEEITGRDGKARMINCFVTFGHYHPTSKNDPDEEIGEWYWVPMVSFRKEGIYDELDPETAAELHSQPNAILNLLGIKH